MKFSEPYEYKDLLLVPFQEGPIANNTYVLADRKENQCIIIDPSYNIEHVLHFVEKNDWQIQTVWLTHAHFDHLMGAAFADKMTPAIQIAMHPDDEIIRANGGSALLGQPGPIERSPLPSVHLADGMTLFAGSYPFLVLHTPGHAPGHCCFYSKDAGWLFTGDLIFYHDYGRTDLIGGSEAVLMKSIREKVMTLPDETMIFPGHEMFTSVGEERQFYR